MNEFPQVYVTWYNMIELVLYAQSMNPWRTLPCVQGAQAKWIVCLGKHSTLIAPSSTQA